VYFCSAILIIKNGCKNTTKNNTMKRIILKHGMGKKIAQTFKVTEQTVINAMRFTTNSALQVKLRAYALNNGGVFVENNKKADRRTMITKTSLIEN
jgi:hypothetical protein